MKKIYLSLTGLILCGSVIGQSAFNIQPRTLREAVIDPNTIIHPTSIPNADRTTTFRMWVEPVGDVMYCKGGITFPPTEIGRAHV